ncbi:tubular protein A [Lentibacter phage vB_LenP_ICBM1]|uniref:Tubular protein A n=2 Tax=Siovirus germanense TaxID=2845497 RepID=A0A3G2YR91_9CAUD|nr:tail protein [Lentibacter phage vB_LenP_ICBM1]AYP28020.1 hypothetical protein [Lentibacter phage vB_LenP_ICBM3]AYP28156.1 tubular protein A [Lentibacter phage vB_LenP_ICBM1]
MKMTLLEMVQNILSDMDSEEINSISDSNEAEQIAQVVKNTYFNMIATRFIPEHSQTIKLTSFSSSARPTHFSFPTRVKNIEFLDYNVSKSVGGVEYRRLKYLSPDEFFGLSDGRDSLSSSVKQVADVGSDSILLIRNDTMPMYYTSFDDDTVVLDSYDASVDATLTSAKTRAYGVKYPTFDAFSDTFVPDIDDTMFPFLLAEAKSTAMSLFKSGSDPKIEQAARRQKVYVQNDMHKVNTGRPKNNYGRH